MKTYQYTNRWGRTIEAYFAKSAYAMDNSLAIVMYGNEDGYWEPYATVTVNLQYPVDKNVAFVDENNLPGIGKWLEENGIAEPTGIVRQSGYCTYPLYRFTDEFLAECE